MTELNSDWLNVQWPRRHRPVLSGWFKSRPEDFQVTEILPVEFSDDGEHWWLWLEKTGSNTEWAARQLAKACGVAPRRVGYAGLKDRQGITGQWFSVQLPKITDMEAVNANLPAALQVKQARWHHKKLRTGALRGNRFEITLRDVQGDRQAAEQTLNDLSQHGFPNYFGAQRFGHNRNNVQQARQAFRRNRLPRQRHQRSLWLSAARSFLFNEILAHRLRHGCWHTVLPGDVLQLAGSHSWFVFNDEDKENESLAALQQRLDAGDLHLTAALWGRGEPATQNVARTAELEAIAPHTDLCRGLEKAGLKPDRRAMRCVPENLSWQWIDKSDKTQLKLTFQLPAGSYATELLAELGAFVQPSPKRQGIELKDDESRPVKPSE